MYALTNFLSMCMNKVFDCTRLVQWCVAIATTLIIVNAPQAAGFEISPVRFEFETGAASKVLTVNNRSATESVVIQAQLLKWTQVGGEDISTPTTDLIANPPIFTIAPNSDQIVRIGPRDPTLARHNSAELSYRILLTEIPPPPSADFRGIGMALRVSVPIFFAPNGRPDQPIPFIDAARDADDRVEATVTNKGTKNFRISGAKLIAVADQKVLEEVTLTQYVLAGGKAKWTFKTKPASGSKYRISMQTERGADSIDIQETPIAREQTSTPTDGEMRSNTGNKP